MRSKGSHELEPAQRGGFGSRKGPNSGIRLELELDTAWHDEDERPVTTEFYRDDSRSILSTNNSADNPLDREGKKCITDPAGKACEWTPRRCVH
jgi:hypothetical protein